ncbi:MAG TPA: phosphatase PAP2 family protein [Aquabacterium sp.]|uniref:phosphatase PAP2 family protein n=1 Tax=Aquabacterium sp. TaxID=1872578 RepID=UPI002E36C2FB|nr:phosphatase PAP2 family protein [Aquabacterium sp.]HEX5355785.1 phosphatase PAP2 family protein [Aquabacterium sp.]
MPFLRRGARPGPIFIVAAFAFALWSFLEVAEEVLDGGAHAFDLTVLNLLGMHSPSGLGDRPAWMLAMARDITALGSVTVLGLMVSAVIVFLAIAGRHMTALFVLMATTSGVLTMTALKGIFHRPRPELLAHGDYVMLASFPSGHAMVSALVYLTLGALLSQLMSSARLKLFVMGAMLILTGLIGISRIYLGVHWPTDVMAGWAAGTAWALACWGAAQWYRIHHGGRA